MCVCDKVNDSIIKQNKQQTNKMLMLHVAHGYLETQLHNLPSPLHSGTSRFRHLSHPLHRTSCCSLICTRAFSLALQAAIKVMIKAWRKTTIYMNMLVLSTPTPAPSSPFFRSFFLLHSPHAFISSHTSVIPRIPCMSI